MLPPAETADDAVQRHSKGATNVNADNPAEGGLDWLKAAASPNIASTSTTAAAVPAAVVMSHQLGTVAGSSASAQSVADVASETTETDWLAAALRGEAPTSSKAPTGVADAAKPVEPKGASGLFLCVGYRKTISVYQHSSEIHATGI